ncbi:hypothetical protein AB4289_06120 [Vibrio cyclitrophicus]
MQSLKFEEWVLKSQVLGKDLGQLIREGVFTEYQAKHEGNNRYERYGVVNHTGNYPFTDSVTGNYHIGRKRFIHLWTDENHRVYQYQMLGQQ